MNIRTWSTQIIQLIKTPKASRPEVRRRNCPISISSGLWNQRVTIRGSSVTSRSRPSRGCPSHRWWSKTASMKHSKRRGGRQMPRWNIKKNSTKIIFKLEMPSSLKTTWTKCKFRQNSSKISLEPRSRRLQAETWPQYRRLPRFLPELLTVKAKRRVDTPAGRESFSTATKRPRVNFREDCGCRGRKKAQGHWATSELETDRDFWGTGNLARPQARHRMSCQVRARILKRRPWRGYLIKRCKLHRGIV